MENFNGKRKIMVNKTDNFNEALDMIKEKRMLIVVTGEAYDKLHNKLNAEDKGFKSKKNAGVIGVLGGVGAIALAHPIVGGIALSAGAISYIAGAGKIGRLLKEYGGADNEEEKQLALIRLRGELAYNPATDVIIDEDGEVQEITFS
jgi:hypothetical protein